LPYQHGEAYASVAQLALESLRAAPTQTPKPENPVESDFELLSEEELDHYLNEKEHPNHEKNA
jgi:hypothetical protein